MSHRRAGSGLRGPWQRKREQQASRMWQLTTNCGKMLGTGAPAHLGAISGCWPALITSGCLSLL